jgi:predicted methyltransferase
MTISAGLQILANKKEVTTLVVSNQSEIRLQPLSLSLPTLVIGSLHMIRVTWHDDKLRLLRTERSVEKGIRLLAGLRYALTSVISAMLQHHRSSFMRSR